MRILINIISALIITLVFVPLVFATVYFLDGNNGNDSWDGLVPDFTAGTNGPRATGAYSADQMIAGDTVWVRGAEAGSRIVLPEGVYFDQADGTAENPITFIGDTDGIYWSDSTDPRGLIIDGENTRTRCFDSERPYINASWFTVTGSKSINLYTGSGASYNTYNNIKYLLLFCYSVILLY